jgi:uncharacterized damage-inducible protein DinB
MVQATSEIERFLELYGALARVTHDWIAAAPDDVLEWVPVDGEGSLFIDGRGRMSILGQYIHISVGDHVQAPQLATCEDGAALNAFDKDIAARLRASPDLIDDARAMHDEDMTHFAAITETQMEKHIFRGEHQWRLVDYLWSIYSHRAFHVGNMDIYLRAAGVTPPAFYPRIQAG